MKSLLFLIVGIMTAVLALSATLNVYFCRKCQAVVKNPKRPAAAKCSAGSAHDWILLGEAGSENWQCMKCNLIIRTNGRPRAAVCPKGSAHCWRKL